MSSRVGRKPVALPQGVTITNSGTVVSIKGKHGTIEQPINAGLDVVVNENELTVVINDKTKEKPLSMAAGTLRALISNAVTGVTEKFKRKLVLIGVGYRVQVKGNELHLTLGFSHPVVHQLPEGITAECPSQTEIILSGINRQLLGQVAADVRAYRPPEPYKGKGVRYADERVIIKETKKK